MNEQLRWILPVPFILFALGGWLYLQTENEVRAQISKAREFWRQGQYQKSIQLYERVHKEYPKSRYADQVLWELANIHYVNLYDVDRALYYFEKLASTRPGSSRAAAGLLRLADIHEVELGDLQRAAEYLDSALRIETAPDFRRGVLFRMGELLLKMDRFDRALHHFEALVKSGHDDHLAQKARIRMGTILQIQSKHAESIDSFQEILKFNACTECRLEARLGLIESYEFLGRFDRAIATAGAIPATEYPEEKKDALLERLGNKAKYYNPTR